MTEIKITETKEIIKIKGTLTSSIQLREEESKESYYCSFIKLKGQSIDLPVIFKIKEKDNLIKPHLKKSDEVELTGHYSNSPQSIRKSFTCLDYCRLATIKKCLGCKGKFTSEKYAYCATCRMPKECIGCDDKFTCFTNEDYDYCSNCEVNNSRYINKESPCSECDDSGLIKFPNQSIRNCKVCCLTNIEKKEDNFFAK